MIVGGSAAVMQGAPLVTRDLDLWIDLPSRQYMRVLNIRHRLNARLQSLTAVVLPGEIIINFLYAVTGLNSFRYEYAKATQGKFHGIEVRLLPLERIIKSKEAIQRPKDLIHLPELRRLVAAKKVAEASKRRPR